MSNEHAPIPLFDALEYLESTLNDQIKQIQSRLPEDIPANEVASDYQHTCQFLHAYRGSAETFKSYRREIERLLQWSWFIHKKSLKELRRSDIEDIS